MPFTFQLFQLTNYVKVLTSVFHLPFMLAHMEPVLCRWFKGSHNGLPWFCKLHLLERNFQDRITEHFTGEALKNIRQFWTTLIFELLNLRASKKVIPSGGWEVLKTVWLYGHWPGTLQQLLHEHLLYPYCIKTAAMHPAFSSVHTNFNGVLINVYNASYSFSFTNLCLCKLKSNKPPKVFAVLCNVSDLDVINRRL